jgi:hypothetical protein
MHARLYEIRKKQTKKKLEKVQKVQSERIPTDT